MSVSTTNSLRVRTDGKFFRLGVEKFHVKGIAYGPFSTNSHGEFFPEQDQTRKDFFQIQRLGANLLRVYYVPPRWFLNLAEEHGLKLLVDIPWNKHLCFLDTESGRSEARKAVSRAAAACASHPAVFALSVVNEIPPDIVRWSGAEAVARFIDELVRVIKNTDPRCLCTFGNFPSTEYLRPKEIDFHCYNVYIHQPQAFRNYLSRLQMIADSKPLILGEFGIDTLREGPERQSEILGWSIEHAFRGGLAGAIAFAYSDDWFKDGKQITDWAFGITSADRSPKPSFEMVQRQFQAAPYFPLDRYPFVSVVVACYNGAKTLQACLESLNKLNYPDFELILVDDGSDDRTAEIASKFGNVQYLRHSTNQGLSVARNTGIESAQGEVVAFTDSDCRTDQDWLYYLVADLLNGSFAGIGGHNLLPPEDSKVAAAVMVSPGGPTHVMLTDHLAEHIPGCNMAFYKWALIEAGCFDPLYRKAGDDVDLCWRLQQRGYSLGFSPSGFVWHYRRSTIREYLRQQRGYGEAEALLVHRHPEYFNWFGSSLWQGRIYSPSNFGVITRPPIIYHGVFGSGFFQTLYSTPPSLALMLVTSLEYHILLTVPLSILSVVFPILWPLAITSVTISLAVCTVAAAQANLSKAKISLWLRPLIAFLFFIQPIVRGWARHRGRLSVRRTSLGDHESLDSVSLRGTGVRFDVLAYWNEPNLGRVDYLNRVMERLDEKGWPNKRDAGWNPFDIEILGSPWCHLHLITASEALLNRREILRCRLRTVWTLLSKTTFCSMLGIELLIVGIWGSESPLLGLLLLTLPAFGFWVAREQNDLQRLISVFLDDLAKELELTKIEKEPALPSEKEDAKGARKPTRKGANRLFAWLRLRF
ncbi:MAG: glycosyltransferase [Verrucomicrobia bacterium]|nr:glycosyltransferase [Verrucomicrobiota bacterium]